MNTILAFSAKQASDLAGLSLRQLSYWSRTDFFPSQFGTNKPGSASSRVYSFRDVVGLRVLATLRKSHNVSLQRLRQIGQYLKDRYVDPWSELTFYIVGNQVYYQDQENEAMMSGQRLGQAVLKMEMVNVAADVQDHAEKLRLRTALQYGRITQNRYVMNNEPVLEGTRIPVHSIWNLHKAGYSTPDILREYPNLAPEDVDAAIEFEQGRGRQKAG